MYLYPDKNDQVTLQYIKESEPYGGYWEKSERCILEKVRKHIARMASENHGLSLLDAGCGEGRLFMQLHTYFTKISAIDPDPGRLAKARETAVLNRIENKISFINAPIEKAKVSEKFNVILCSHVLQHVHTGKLPVILSGFRKMLRPEGLLFILTCHSTRDMDYYTKSYMNNGHAAEVEIGRNEFNLLTNGIDVLPAHFFTQGSLSRLLSAADFKLLDCRVFHNVGDKTMWFEKWINRDSLVNTFGFLRKKKGRDIYIAVR